MPEPPLCLLLLVLSLAAAAAARTTKTRPEEPEPEPAVAAGQIKDRTISVITKTSPPGWLSIESPEQAGLQKDHLSYRHLWEKEDFLILRNGREFDLESETRTSTYKNKKLRFRNIVLKLPLFQGKQANNGIRKATVPQSQLGRKNISPALTKTRVSALVRKTRCMEKQNNMKAELQKELDNGPSRKTRLSVKCPLQFATVDLNRLARKWWWLKGVFLKAPLNTLASAVRNNQGIRGNLEDYPKPQKKDALSSRPLKLRRVERQGIRIWKPHDLRIAHKEPWKSSNSERTASVEGEGEPEKALRERQGSLNSLAHGTSTWKVQSRLKILFGRPAKMGKGLPASLVSMKTKSVVIQPAQAFGNRVILSVTKCAQITDGCSRDTRRRQNGTESRDIVQLRNEGQEAKGSISDIIQEKLKFLFKLTSKDRAHRVNIWSVYVTVPLKLRERKAKIFQREIDRLVDQDGNQADSRASNRKSEVAPGAPELEDEEKIPQWLRLEECGGGNSWNKVQAPFTVLLHRQLYAFIIRPHFNNSVMSQEKLTAFIEPFMAQLPTKIQPELAKLTGVLKALKVTISPKASSFPLESQQANSVRNLGKMRRLTLNLWKTKHVFPAVLPSDLKLRSKKAVEPNNHDVSVTIQYRKLLHDSESLSSDLLYFPGFAPSSELSKRQKRDAHGDTQMIQVPLDFLNHLSSLLGIGVGVVAVAFIFLCIVFGVLFYKRRELFQVSNVKVIDGKCRQKLSSPAMDSRFCGVSLSRCFHSSGLRVSRHEELQLQRALQKHKRRKLSFVLTSITSNVSDTSSSVESMNPDQRSFLSSSGSFCSQSLEASQDWFSDEEGSLCTSSIEGGLVDRVQVCPETTDAAKNFQEFQCDVTVGEDQNYLGLEKTNQQKMQMPKSVSSPLKASSDIPCSPESRDDHSRASTSIPHPPQPRANASEESSGIPHPPQSRDDLSRASSSIPCLPQPGSNASKAASDISCLP